MPVVTGDETDEEAGALRQTRETEASRQARVKRAWNAVMATPEGRAMMWDLLKSHLGLYASPVSTDKRQEQRNLGKHEAALGVLAAIEERTPRFVKLMKQENDN